MAENRKGRLLTAAGAGLFVLLVASAPFLVVWRQVYISTNAPKLQSLCDSAAVLEQGARLRVEIEKLSSIQRIETIARDQLGLDYPASSQIVIMHNAEHRDAVWPWQRWRLLGVLRHSLGQENG